MVENKDVIHFYKLGRQEGWSSDMSNIVEHTRRGSLQNFKEHNPLKLLVLSEFAE
jgi:hypothetical protein